MSNVIHIITNKLKYFLFFWWIQPRLGGTTNRLLVGPAGLEPATNRL
jgi:hypothetical protein